MMKRRQFITLLGGAAATWPLVARAQQACPMRRVAVMMSGAEADPVFVAYVATLRQGLQQQGWIEGKNLQLELRFNDGDAARIEGHARELVGLAPDVIVASGATGTRALQRLTQTIPIVFVQVGDPVAAGVVASVARPEGNTTGLTNQPASIAGKWPELLKEAAPGVTRAALIFDPGFPVNETYLASIEAASAALAVKAIRAPVHSASDIERAVNAFATEPNGGLVLVPPPLVRANRESIVRLARLHRLPVVSYDRAHGVEGFLLCYGPGTVDIYRNAASYVDRILHGAKPSELPVQFPTMFELVINLKAAKAIGLTVPPALIARADEVIE